MKLVAYCETCRHQHPIDLDPMRPDNQIGDWYVKHGGHTGVGVTWLQRSPKPSFLERFKRFWSFGRTSAKAGLAAGAVSAVPMFPFDTGPRMDAILAFLPNATVKITYAASAAPTLTLASLAASSTLLGGRESTSVLNTSNLYIDYYYAGIFRQAATNTAAGIIKVGCVGALNDTPTWPDVFDGTDSAETVTTQAIYDSCVRVIAAITTAATASAYNPFAPVGIAQFFGFLVPTSHLVFVSQTAQTTTNAWSATEGDHTVKYTPVYFTVA